MQTERSDREDTITSANWDNPTAEEEQRVITLSVCGGALFIKLKQHGLHCLSLHHQHICRYCRFHCDYAFTYSNELFIIHSKLVKWAITACGYFHQGLDSLRVVQIFSLLFLNQLLKKCSKVIYHKRRGVVMIRCLFRCASEGRKSSDQIGRLMRWLNLTQISPLVD